MKFVYVLISNENDFLAEQALVSMFSLKYFNPDSNIILYTDKESSNYLKETKNKILKFIDEIIIVNVPIHLSQKQRSRYIKTSLRFMREGDFIYIDCDTVICGSLNEMFKTNYQMGAVLDNHGLLYNFQYNDYIKKVNHSYIKFNHYFNAGVLFVKDTTFTRNFFVDWHNLWLKDLQLYNYDSDQPSFNIINHKYNLIHVLSPIYNCHYIIPDKENDVIEGALILHYITSLPFIQIFFPIRERKFLNKLRINGLSEELKTIILNPKEFIYQIPNPLNDIEKKFNQSPVVILARKISRDFPWTNKIIRTLYRILGYKI